MRNYLSSVLPDEIFFKKLRYPSFRGNLQVYRWNNTTTPEQFCVLCVLENYRKHQAADAVCSHEYFINEEKHIVNEISVRLDWHTQ